MKRRSVVTTGLFVAAAVLGISIVGNSPAVSQFVPPPIQPLKPRLSDLAPPSATPAPSRPLAPPSGKGERPWWVELPKRAAVMAVYPPEGQPYQSPTLVAAFTTLRHYMFIRLGRVPEFGDPERQFWEDYGGGMQLWDDRFPAAGLPLYQDEKFRLQVLSRFLSPASVNAYRNSPLFRKPMMRTGLRDPRDPPDPRDAPESARGPHETVFGIPVGGFFLARNCAETNARPCQRGDTQNDLGSALENIAQTASGMWRPALLGKPARLAMGPLPDWIATDVPLEVRTTDDGVVASILMRAVGNHGDFRGDLIEKFGAPTREGRQSYKNKFGNTWSAPVLEWKKGDLHVQFVPDGTQDNDSAWGVLLIESDAAYQARWQHEAKARQQRPKL